MRLRTSLFIASRYLLGRGKEGGRYLRGAALGIALSMIPIVITLVVADGMIAGITDRYLELGTSHIQVYNRFLAYDPAEELETVRSVEGVRECYVERQGLGILVGKKGKTGATVRALSPGFYESPGIKRYLKVVSGTATLSGNRDVLIGEGLADLIGISVGDTVRLMTTKVENGGKTVPRITPFKVAGIVSSGYRELDALWCLMTYDAGLEILSFDNSRSYIGVKIDDPFTGADAMAVRLQSSLPSDFSMYTWKELSSTQYASYASTRELLLFIMALIVLVAAVTVSSATSMLVVERRRDIAVLKSFGADQRGTIRTFVCGAFLAGTIGTVIGISLGLILAVNINSLIAALEVLIGFWRSVAAFFSGSPAPVTPVKLLNPSYYLETIPVVIDWAALGVIAFGTIACSVLAAWLPARQAGKLSPTEILRRY